MVNPSKTLTTGSSIYKYTHNIRTFYRHPTVQRHSRTSCCYLARTWPHYPAAPLSSFWRAASPDFLLDALSALVVLLMNGLLFRVLVTSLSLHWRYTTCGTDAIILTHKHFNKGHGTQLSLKRKTETSEEQDFEEQSPQEFDRALNEETTVSKYVTKSWSLHAQFRVLWVHSTTCLKQLWLLHSKRT